jgi:hypothetical protein
MSVTRVLLIAIVSFTAACDHAPTRPTVTEQPPITTVPPSPSPAPTLGSISGNWAWDVQCKRHRLRLFVFRQRTSISELYATGRSRARSAERRLRMLAHGRGSRI